MEATFLNFCDENFTTLSHFCRKDEPDNPDSGLLDLIHDDFSYQASNFGVAVDLWETEQESNSASTVLPVPIPQEGIMSRMDHSNKEDFQKMLFDWQEHLGSLQVSDTEEIDAVPEQLPDNIFEDPIYENMFAERQIFTSVSSKLTPSISIKEDDINVYNLDELLDCADDNDDKLPIKIHEHVLRKMGQFNVDSTVKPEIKAPVKSESGTCEAGSEPVLDTSNQRKSVKFDPSIAVKRESFTDCRFMKINDLNEHLTTAKFAKGGNTVSAQDVSSELLNCDLLKMEEKLLKTFPKIKVEPSELAFKLEVDEDCIDIETVSEQIPVLEAGDLKSLLEQFEASEAVSPNIATGTATSLQPQLPADSTQEKEEVDSPTSAAASTPSPTKVTSAIKPPITLPSSGQQTTFTNVTTSIAASVVSSTLTTHTPASHIATAIPSCLKISNSATRPLLKSLHLSHSVSAVSVAANQCYKDSKLCDRSSPPTSIASSGSSSPVSQPTTPPQSNHKIQESLSAALIEKLKASGRKKTIPVIPAMPTKRSGRGATRMQDAGAALSRNKLLKIVSGGESIQLDHDYCSMSSGTVEAPRPFYHSDASEYSVAPNASLLLPQEQQMKHSTTDCWENSSRKDSGLESGDVSDASEEAGGSSIVTSVDCGSGTVITTLKSTVTSAQIQPGTSLLRKSLNTGPHVVNTASQKQKQKQLQQQQQQHQQQSQQMPQKQLQHQHQNFQKKQQQHQQQQQQQQHQHQKEQQLPSSQTQQAPKKRKLNLEEYRNRLKDRDRAKDTFMGTSRIISLADIPMPPSNTAVEVNKKCSESAESRVRPEMCNAEVQADVSKEMGATSEAEKRLGRLRDHRHRQYRSKRHSSSSSSSSDSSQSSSRSSHSSSYSPSRRPRRQKKRSRHHRRSRSRRRTSNKRRHSSASRSCSHSTSSRSSSGSSSSSYSSRSRSSSSSSGARFRSRSWSRSRSRSRSRWNFRPSHHNGRPRRDGYADRWQRSRSPFRGPRCRNSSQISDREKQRQVEERRVIYVGRIDEGTSKAQLRKRFEVFGPIVDISVHFREHGDNYGFVTYMYKKDAYEAVEHGNDDPHIPQYDLCFGGRRAFCKTRYADLVFPALC